MVCLSGFCLLVLNKQHQSPPLSFPNDQVALTNSSLFFVAVMFQMPFMCFTVKKMALIAGQFFFFINQGVISNSVLKKKVKEIKLQ